MCLHFLYKTDNIFVILSVFAVYFSLLQNKIFVTTSNNNNNDNNTVSMMSGYSFMHENKLLYLSLRVNIRYCSCGECMGSFVDVACIELYMT